MPFDVYNGVEFDSLNEVSWRALARELHLREVVDTKTGKIGIIKYVESNNLIGVEYEDGTFEFTNEFNRYNIFSKSARPRDKTH